MAKDATGSLVGVGVAVLLGLAGAGVAGAAEDGPTARGAIRGSLERAGRASFRVDASHPDGWRALAEVRVVLELHGVALEEVAVDVDDGVITLGPARAVLGTGDGVSGRFLAIAAIGVRLTTGGNRLSISFPARVLADVPEDARVRFVAEDDAGASAESVVRAAAPEEEDPGLSIWTAALAAGLALVAGGFIGARAATHRRSRPSVYGAVARRIRNTETTPRR